jgi:oxygen-independent coproporphyrinogen-3 oxidase
MHIRIHGIDPTYYRGVEHVIRLFYEEVTVSFETVEQQQQQGISLSLHLENGTAKANLETEVGIFSAQAYRNADKQRYALHDVVLQVFEAYTGIIQPWGVLTGIRPTKKSNQKKYN